MGVEEPVKGVLEVVAGTAARIGLNVPPGFVITTEACLAYLEDSQRQLPEGAMDEVRAHMRALDSPPSNCAHTDAAIVLLTAIHAKLVT